MSFRSYRIVILSVAALALAAPASTVFADPPAAMTPATLPAPVAGKGQVVFYRKPLFSLIPFNWKVREGKMEVCEMIAGTYCVADIDPGTHTFEVHSEVKNDLTLEVDAGETYYVIGGISMGLIVNHPNISSAQKAQFDAISAKLKVQPQIMAIPGGAAAPAAAPAAPAADPAKPTP